MARERALGCWGLPLCVWVWKGAFLVELWAAAGWPMQNRGSLPRLRYQAESHRYWDPVARPLLGLLLLLRLLQWTGQERRADVFGRHPLYRPGQLCA